MVIQHNISAINAHRQLGINNSFTGRNLEKLSSGFRVNRAGDDAAGLAISEKMRGQIRGLGMAEQNSQHGISVIQTAEGALNEAHAILQRLRELATQSSNGTYQEEVDRENLDKEAQALKSELDRIASSTHYNGIKLLNGNLSRTGAAVTTYGADANTANPRPYAVSTNPITVVTGYNSVDQVGVQSTAWTITTGDDNHPTGGFGTQIASFSGELPVTGQNINGKFTVTHGSVSGTYSVSFKIDNQEWKNESVGGSETSFKLTHSNGSTFTVNFPMLNPPDRTMKSWADNVGELGAFGSGKKATGTMLVSAIDHGTGSPITTTYAGTPEKPGSEVYTTVDTVDAPAGGSLRTENLNRGGINGSGLNVDLANWLTVNGFSGEVGGNYGALSMKLTVSHSTDNGKYLVMFESESRGWQWTAHVDGSETSFEVTMDGGPAAGGSSFMVNVPGGKTLKEWADTDGALGSNGSGKSAYGYVDSIRFDDNGEGSLKTDGDPDDPTDPTDPTDPGNPTDPTDPPVTPPVYPPVYGNALVFQIGANGAADQRVSLSIEDMSSKSLGRDTARVSGVSITTRQYANDAIAVLDAAINQISGTRADLGAMQNRLEHTINNLGVAKENLTSAESSIRDADMAKEMMMFTKNNILTQASQSMLAQANQLPQGVLQLLQ